MAIDIDKVYEDARKSHRYLSKVFKAIKKDFEYALGKQWKDADVRQLETAGVKALTINKIRPLIKLITGIERQSRSDYKAYPEGTEDEILAEVSTRLVKNVSKTSRLKNKLSDTFKEGVIGGMCYIEPYLDYTEDLLNGEMKFRKIEGKRILFDPAAEEYDLSDGKYLIKLTFGLTEEDLLTLFPEDKEKIDSISKGNIDLSIQSDDDKHQALDYPKDGDTITDIGVIGKTYDLVEYYYKNPINIYYVLSKSQGVVGQFEDKKQAELVIAQSQIIDATIITKRTYEIRLKQIVGDVEFLDVRADTYPRWKGYPIFPFFSERMTVDIEDTDLLIQGVTRSLVDLQEEYNKRRTQELRHLNSSVNSGMFIPKDALDNKNKKLMKEFGSSPGVQIEYDPEKTGGVTPQNWRIQPTQLSQGHAQLAAENAQDIKEAGGVNPDLLASDNTDQSGRSKLIQQRQGLVMVQEMLDNYTQTKEMIGRFILSQLSEIFTVETAMKVLGDKFLSDNFKKPKFDMEGNPQLDDNGQLQTEPDVQGARALVNQVLNDSSLGKYDVTIGEGTYNETIQLANFITLSEMAEKGIPIPADVLVEESLLSANQKEKILKSISQQNIQQAKLQQSQSQEAI